MAIHPLHGAIEPCVQPQVFSCKRGPSDFAMRCAPADNLQPAAAYETANNLASAKNHGVHSIDTNRQ